MFSPRHKPGILARARNVLWPSIGLRRAWRYRLARMARMKSSDHRLAMGFAAGAFVSFTPFIGLHFVLAAAVAFVMRGNLVASAVGTVVGNPLTFPAIWLATYNIGAALLGLSRKQSVTMDGVSQMSLWSDGPMAVASLAWQNIGPVLLPMCIGALPLGLACAATCYAAVFAGLKGLRQGRSAGLKRQAA